MHVLWLIPDYHTFLVEELAELAKRVSSVSVLSQAPAVKIPGVKTVQIQPINKSLGRAARRVSSLVGITLAMSRHESQDANRLFLARWSDAISAYMRQQQIDVVHSHFACPGGTGGRFATCGRPLVVTLRGVDILSSPEVNYGSCLDGGYTARLRQCLRSAELVTVASTVAEQAVREQCGQIRSLRVLPNGVNRTAFAQGDPARGRHALGVREEPLLLAVGNLIPLKRFEDIIRALRIVHAKHLNATLAILGVGPQRESLESIASACGLADRVRFPGRVKREDIPDYFAACDAFIHASLSEGFGNVVLEAMAAGKPVVATRSTGAAVDLIQHEKNGLLFNAKDVQTLAGHLDLLLSDQQAAKRLGTAGREAVATGFSLEDRAKRFVSLYDEVLQSRTAPRTPSEKAV